MTSSQSALFVHLVWSTWERQPLLTEAMERSVHRALSVECTKAGAEPLAIGGVEDHVHLLVRVPLTLAVADLVKQLKGATAFQITHQIAPEQFFKWQPGYGHVSVSPSHIDQVTRYINHQREHHANGRLNPLLEDPS